MLSNRFGGYPGWRRRSVLLLYKVQDPAKRCTVAMAMFTVKMAKVMIVVDEVDDRSPVGQPQWPKEAVRRVPSCHWLAQKSKRHGGSTLLRSPLQVSRVFVSQRRRTDG